ncbi:MFS transporter [Nocardia sp. CA2R105]|uniref:MFS transporter n=1 Tax=Nocardia coffeae TaxID=2873381 RepID=UPI001CA7198B|nr:MFS transporter [Nocardia coffeae]MBY8863753.1 MFS transporter [Nocardia coffeae]
MGASTLVPRVRISRAAVFTVFGLNGFLCSMWVVHIPVITQRTGVSKGTLGLLILLVALGGIAGMQATGPLADRFGSRTLMAVAGTWLSLAVLGPAFATGPLTLAVALLLFGTGNGALDVSMNAQAVQVERAYPRPIMSAFHAMFSCGGLAGSLVGAATMHRGWDVRVTMTAAGAIGLLTLALSIPRLLPRVESDSDTTTSADHESPGARRSASLRVLALAAIAFGFLLTEGVANDWSALQVREHLSVSDATAALAFGAFSTTMTAGRFAADRVSARFGRVAVVRWGAVLAAVGLTLIVSSVWLAPTLLGWALLGIGLAGGVPQIFSAAGNLGTRSAATDMSRVFGLGYLGFLAGPSMIGWLADLSSLTAALIFPLALILVCAASARIVAPSS